MSQPITAFIHPDKKVDLSVTRNGSVETIGVEVIDIGDSIIFTPINRRNNIVNGCIALVKDKKVLKALATHINKIAVAS